MGDVVKLSRVELAAMAIAGGASACEAHMIAHRPMPGINTDCPASEIVAGYRREACEMANQLLNYVPELPRQLVGDLTDDDLVEIAVRAEFVARYVYRYLEIARAARRACNSRQQA